MDGASELAKQIRERIEIANLNIDELLILLREGKRDYNFDVDLEDLNGAEIDWQSDALKSLKVKQPLIVEKRKL